MADVRAAFFDVDETLIAVKSMFSFLEYHWSRLGRPPGDYHEVRARFARAAAGTTSREQANREYYRLYAGQDATMVAGHGESWLRRELARGRLFVEPVLADLRRYRSAGTAVVLVSGSFPAVLDPLARYVDATAVLCSVPEIVDGRYTGALVRPMIGAHKAQAVRRFAEVRGLPLDACAGYGDHGSDLELLTAVGHPVVVGEDPVLTAHARRYGWPRLATVG